MSYSTSRDNLAARDCKSIHVAGIYLRAAVEGGGLWGKCVVYAHLPTGRSSMPGAYIKVVCVDTCQPADTVHNPPRGPP